MTLWPRRRPPLGPAHPRTNRVRIAVLEHDLLGIPPTPGTAAALAIVLRRVGTCLEHDPVQAIALGDARTHGLCGRCGVAMLVGDNGEWQAASA